MHIEVWSDIACPWCWLGKHHLSEALPRLAADDVTVTYRSFELQPDMTRTRPVREHLIQKYGSLATIQAAERHLVEAGAAVGLGYHFEDAVASNTFDAHRLHHYARDEGLGDEMLERLFKARQGEGADTADHGTLAALAQEVGLDDKGVRAVLEGDAYEDAVRKDEAEAQALGIHGVPFFVFDRKYAVSGAQPVDVFEDVVGRIRSAQAE